MPNDSATLTELQRAVIEHDSDMARLDRNRLSTKPMSEAIQEKHSQAITKEIALLRSWLDYIERDVTSGSVIHAMLLADLGESCTKIIYRAGILNGALLTNE